MEKRKRRHGRRKNKEFMDAALDAFIRDQALKKMREVDGLIAGAGLETTNALQSAKEFLEKGPYRQIWIKWWQEKVLEDLEGASEHLFARIENAMRFAVMEEKEERLRRNDALLEDSLPYQSFVTHALDNLFWEASGEIEELD